MSAPATIGLRAPVRRAIRGVGPHPAIRPFISIGIVAVLWIVATGFVPERILPTLPAVFAAGSALVAKGILPSYVQESLRHLLVASLAGILIAVPAGLALGMSGRVAAFFSPLLSFFAALSGIAWLPMMLVWFGFNEKTIVVSINYTVVFPVVYATLLGVQTVPQVYVSAVRTMGGGRWTVIRDVIVPGALPSIITGVRLGMAYGWRALVAAEMLVAANGLGFLIFSARSVGDLSSVIVGMLVIGTLWLSMDRLVLRPIEVATVERWGLLRT